MSPCYRCTVTGAGNNILFSLGVLTAGAIIDLWPLTVAFVGLGAAIVLAVPFCWRIAVREPALDLQDDKTPA